MISDAATVEEYLASLPLDRQKALTHIRREILKALPTGYEEVMNWGMITYQVPLSVYPDTYNKKPFMFVALASQKNHMAIYLMNVYSEPGQDRWLRKEFTKAGKKLDMGKSCIRFKKLEDITLDPILKLIQSCEMDTFVARAKSTFAH